MNRPYVICHMLTSLDGKIDGLFMSAPETRPVAVEYGRLRSIFQCQATMYGATTMEEVYAEGRAPALEPCAACYPHEDYIAESDVNNYIVSIDPESVLGWASKYIEKKGRPRVHVIEVLTEQVSNEYLNYLHSFDISYIFAGEKDLDCTLALRKLKELFRIDHLLLAGGAVINASLLQRGLIDELSIGFVAFSPLANGFLSGKYDQNSKFEAETDYRGAMPQFTPQAMERNRALLELVRDTARTHNATPAQISLAWMLCKNPRLVPIPDIRKPDRLRKNLGAADVVLTPNEVSAIDRALDEMEMSAVFGGSQIAGK